MPKYRYVGTVATEVSVGDKCVPVAPGDFVTLSADEAKNLDNPDKFMAVEKAKSEGGDK